MGYALKYDLQSIQIKKKIKKQKAGYLAMTFLLIICTVAMCFGGSIFQTIILGQRATAKAAAEQMVTDIRDGVSLTEAVQAFCTELAE